MVWLTFLLHDMASWNIYSKNGVLKYTTKAVEYNEEWMVSESVTFSVTSQEPIYFEVGDYLTYRGLRYSVYSLPSTLKTSRINTYGEGFKWDNIRFYSDIMRLSEIRFLDYVLYDNELHYTSLPNFSFYAETVDDLVDRIQANANHTDSGWIFLTPNLQRTWERYDISMKDEITALWKSYYGEHGENVDLGRNVNNVNITVSNNNLSEALAMVYNQFGVHYISRDKVVIVGMAGIEAEHVFKYGKGEGLYEIERVADEDQQIVTRLYAYGSDKNLPLRYYAELNTQVFDEVASINVIQNDEYQVFVQYGLSLYWNDSYFTNDTEVPWMAFEKQHVVRVSAGGYEIVAVAYLPGGTNKIHLSCIHNYNYDRGAGEEKDATKLLGFISALSVGDKVYFTGYVNKSAFPADNITYVVQDLPDNMSVNVLMLPGFPNYALSELCKSEYDSVNDKTNISYRKTPSDAYNVIMTIPGSHLISFSTDKYRPYIESPNVSTLGIKEGVVEFTEETDENGKQEVYPTIEGMTVGEVFGTSSTERLDEVVSATMITDNGVFGEGEIPNFEIVLKNLGFDLEEAFMNGGSSMVISMKDGYCGGRDFSVKSVHKIAETEQWKLNVERHQDAALSLYFPYSDHVSHGEEPIADEPYQIRTGDHFVLTEIDISDTTYINAASVRALKKAINLLLENDYMRYTYMPKIDEIFMAMERDDAEANSRTSLHDWLKGGMLMHFQDTDLDFDNSVFIDHITIKEGSSPIPTYEIVLREKKQVSTMQRILNQISNYGTTGSGGGLSRGQVLSIVSAYADPRFLSKLNADTANGLITFLQGIRLGNYAQGSTGGKFDENGNAEANSLVVRGQTEQRGNLIFGNVPFIPGATGGAVRQIDNDIHAEVDYLSVRKKMAVTEVEIQEVNYVGGNIVLSPADGFTITDVEWDEEENLFYVYFDALDADTGDMVTPQWQVGDLAFSQKFNIQNSSGGELIHSWWREVEQVVLITREQDPHYGKCILWLRNDSGHCKSIYDGENDYNMPEVGDKVVMLGHIQQSGESATDAKARQGAIILASAGGTTDTNALPYIRVYKDINTFDLSQATLVHQISYSGLVTNTQNWTLNVDLGGGTTPTQVPFNDLYAEIDDVASQLDESFQVWQVDYDKTTPPSLSNLPASQWGGQGQDPYSEHVGDFCITSDGFCYEFKEITTGNYGWVIVTDQYLISYVEQIGEKKRIFPSRPSNNAMYEVGDVWLNAVYPDDDDAEMATMFKGEIYDNVTLVCKRDKSNGFDIDDWGIAEPKTTWLHQWQTGATDTGGASHNMFIGTNFGKLGRSTYGNHDVIYEPREAAGFRIEPNSAAIQLWYKRTEDESDGDESDDYGCAELRFDIDKTQRQSTAKLKADNITLEGYTTINGNFKIDEDGNMEAVAGAFSGFITNRETLITCLNLEKYFDVAISPYSGDVELELKMNMVGQNFSFYSMPEGGSPTYSSIGGSSATRLPENYDILGNWLDVYIMGHTFQGVPLGDLTGNALFLNLPFDEVYLDKSHFQRSDIIRHYVYESEYGLSLYREFNNDITIDTMPTDDDPERAPDWPNDATEGWPDYPFEFEGIRGKKAHELVGCKIHIRLYGGEEGIALSLRGIMSAKNGNNIIYDGDPIPQSSSTYHIDPYEAHDFSHWRTILGINNEYNEIILECIEIPVENNGNVIAYKIGWQISFAQTGYYDRYTLGLDDNTSNE